MAQGTQVETRTGHEEGAAGVLPQGAVRIDVAYAEKGRVKALGARWDPGVKSWYVPEGVELGGFDEWLPLDLDAERRDLGLGDAAQGPQVGVALLGLRLPCWKCNRDTVTMVGLRRGETDLLLLDTELGKRAGRALLPETVRVAASVGRVERRFIRKLGRRALANGCHWCDALQADRRLFAEDMAQVLSAGSEALEPLVTAEIPLDLWERLRTEHAPGESAVP